MGQLQHRGGKYSKIVLKHHPLEGLVKVLQPVEALVEVQTIVPGVITAVRGRPIGSREAGGMHLKVQYIAPDGHIRLLVRLGNATQEVRVVSTVPEKSLAEIKLLFGQ